MILNWKDNRGYTLVELIISMAVLSIVALTIMMLMKYGTGSFAFAKSELDLQMESQTLMAQMNSMVMESDAAEYDSAHKVLLLYQMETEKQPVPTDHILPGADRYLEVNTVKDIKLIKFNKKDNKLYLEEYSKGSHDASHNLDSVTFTSPASGGAVTYADNQLFAEYINDFSANVSNGKVTVTLDMKSGKRTYKADVTSKIRNRLVACP